MLATLVPPALAERSPVLERLLRAARPRFSTFWRVALEGLVEAEQLAAAAPADPALRDIADTLEALFLATARRVFAGRPQRPTVLADHRAARAGLSWRSPFKRPTWGPRRSRGTR